MSKFVRRTGLTAAVVSLALLATACHDTVGRQLGLGLGDAARCQQCLAVSAKDVGLEHVGVSRQALAREIRSQLIASGGCTLDPRTARPVGAVDAYAVSRAEHEMRLTQLPTTDQIEQYLQRHERALSSDRLYVGAWHDEATGAYYLDLSELFNDRGLAEARGRAQRQQCIYHLATGSEIRLN